MQRCCEGRRAQSIARLTATTTLRPRLGTIAIAVPSGFKTAGTSPTRQSVDCVGNERDRIVSSIDSDRVRIHEQTAQRLTEKANLDLDGRQGCGLDAALAGMIAGSHLQQITTLEVLTTKAEGELQFVLNNALTSIGQHKQQAGQVIDAIKPVPATRR